MNIIDPRDPRLWTPAAAVDDIPRQVLPLLPEIRACMAQARFAVALSAPQVGVGLRFFVTDGRNLPSVVVNPEILERDPFLQPGKEGCLSFPGKWADVRRPYWIRVRFLNVKGDLRQERFSGHSARIFQHEADHLDGVCIFPRPTDTEGADRG